MNEINKSTASCGECDSVATKEKAEKITSDIDELISKGSFAIKHWTISGDISKDDKHIMKSLSSDLIGNCDISKVLGMLWNSNTDKLSFNIRLNFSKKVRKLFTLKNLMLADMPNGVPVTLSKRMILSQMNGIFDPLGLLGPFVVRAKCYLQ